MISSVSVMPLNRPRDNRRVPLSVHLGVVAIAVGLCCFIWWVTGDLKSSPVKPMPKMVEGAVIDVPITLVAADKSDLACAFDGDVDGLRCAFQGRDVAWADIDTKNAEVRKRLLAPYMTVDKTMLLIPGLFENPEVDGRVRDEAPRRLARNKQRRFTAQCKVVLRRAVGGVLVRWVPNKAWEGPHKVWVGEAGDCVVVEP